MSSTPPRLQNAVVMSGPNLLAPLPGARLAINWPPTVLAGGAPFAMQLALRLFSTPSMQPAAATAPLDRFSNVHDAQAALDRLVEVLAGAVAHICGQPAIQHVNLLTSPNSRDGVSVHHRDSALAASAGRAAFALAVAGIETASEPDLAARVDSVLRRFRRHWQEVGFGEANWRKLDAAERRDIPWSRAVLHDRTVRLGHGFHQVMTRDSMTGDDSYIGTCLATDKALACEVMHSNGLPAPRNVAVLDRNAALKAARTLGYPVVVKPATTDFGTAVSVNLRSDEEVAAAFDQARRYGTVIVEQHVPGTNFRLLVIDGKFVAAVRQDPAQVMGDGVHSVDGLVQIANRERSDYLSARLKRIKIDENAVRVLQRQGLNIDSVPAMGQRVLLREHSNLSVGGSYENVTATVHPDNRALTERAARVFGLKTAGIDYISVDVSRSHLETGGKICEINPSPGLVMGMPEFAAEDALLDSMFPDGSDGRIPIVAILSDRPAPGLTGRLEAMAVELGHTPSVAMPGAIRCGGRTVAAGSFDQTMAANVAIHDPSASAAIVQLSRRDIARAGLAFDRCAVSIVVREPATRGAGHGTEGADAAIIDLLRRHSRVHLTATDATATESAVRAALLDRP
ncbi:MAG: hypothetical protein AB7F36_15590 [Reyranellaceae bacterium]